MESVSVEKRTRNRPYRQRKLYNVWSNMRYRCYEPKTRSYCRYGARGITVCDEWGTFAVFKRWAMANGYRDGLTLDRVDANGNYGPSNCRFVTPVEQQNNRRDNRKLAAFGETKTMAQWLRDPRCVVRFTTLRRRLNYGWDNEIALTKIAVRNRTY